MANEIKKIFVRGDLHGDQNYNELKEFIEERGLTHEDMVIILGDAGILWSEKTKPEMIALYNNLGCRIGFLDGNHENFDLLQEYPVVNWCGGKIHEIAENIIHLMRGQIFIIPTAEKTVKIATMGGGDSRDKEIRLEHEARTNEKIWWSQETVTIDDIDELKRNVAIHGNEVDYFLSHCPSATVKVALFNESVDIYTYGRDKYLPMESDYMVRRAINECRIKAKAYISGHEHIDREEMHILGKDYKILFHHYYEL